MRVEGDDSVGVLGFLAEQGVVVVQGGDRGGGCVKLVVEDGVLAGLVREFRA